MVNQLHIIYAQKRLSRKPRTEQDNPNTPGKVQLVSVIPVKAANDSTPEPKPQIEQKQIYTEQGYQPFPSSIEEIKKLAPAERQKILDDQARKRQEFDITAPKVKPNLTTKTGLKAHVMSKEKEDQLADLRRENARKYSGHQVQQTQKQPQKSIDHVPSTGTPPELHFETRIPQLSSQTDSDGPQESANQNVCCACGGATAIESYERADPNYECSACLRKKLSSNVPKQPQQVRFGAANQVGEHVGTGRQVGAVVANPAERTEYVGTKVVNTTVNVNVGQKCNTCNKCGQKQEIPSYELEDYAFTCMRCLRQMQLQQQQNRMQKIVQQQQQKQKARDSLTVSVNDFTEEELLGENQSELKQDVSNFSEKPLASQEADVSEKKQAHKQRKEKLEFNPGFDAASYLDKTQTSDIESQMKVIQEQFPFLIEKVVCECCGEILEVKAIPNDYRYQEILEQIKRNEELKQVQHQQLLKQQKEIPLASSAQLGVVKPQQYQGSKVKFVKESSPHVQIQNTDKLQLLMQLEGKLVNIERKTNIVQKENEFENKLQLQQAALNVIEQQESLQKKTFQYTNDSGYDGMDFQFYKPKISIYDV